MADDEPSEVVPLDEWLVEAYWEYNRTLSHDWFWAWEAVEAAVDARLDGLVEFLVALAAAAKEEKELCDLGAGPIENLLRWNGPPPPSLIEALDAAVQSSPGLQTAMRCVWWGEDNDPKLVARFSRFGPPL